MVNELLDKHVFGRIVADVELAKLWKGPTEYVDSKSRSVRHADMVWKAPFRDSWLYMPLPNHPCRSRQLPCSH